MKKASIRAWKARAGFPLAMFLLVLCVSKLSGDDAAAVEITRKAYRIAQNGQIDTDLPFSRFFDDSFTISAWVMPEFTYNWKGAIFTVNGVRGSGSFRVGQGDYRAGNGGVDKVGDPVLEVELNGIRALYLAPGYQRRKWNHIAIVRGNAMYVGPTLRLFLNGKKLQAFTRVNVGTQEDPVYVFNPALDISVSQAGSPEPAGTLRLGRQGKAQFYGLIDDVAVYNRAFDPAGIESLMNSPISATHPNLIGDFTFDTYAPAILVAVPKYVATPNSRAFSVQNAHPHDNSDNMLFDNPFLVSPSAVVRRLPFSTGQIWRVNYEFDDQGGSHNGTAAFCWDFVRLDASTMQDPVVAAAPGLLSYVNDSVNGAGVVEVVPGQEADVYMHTAGGSWWDEFLAPWNYSLYPQPTQSATWVPVDQGHLLAKLDPGEQHLHRAVRHMGNGDGTEYTPTPTTVLPTIPSSFDNYQRFREDVPQECHKTNAAHWQNDDCWIPVLRGMPRKGQVLRRVY
jgi:hypothetical protein